MFFYFASFRVKEVYFPRAPPDPLLLGSSTPPPSPPSGPPLPHTQRRLLLTPGVPQAGSGDVAAASGLWRKEHPEIRHCRASTDAPFIGNLGPYPPPPGTRAWPEQSLRAWALSDSPTAPALRGSLIPQTNRHKPARPASSTHTKNTDSNNRSTPR